MGKERTKERQKERKKKEYNPKKKILFYFLFWFFFYLFVSFVFYRQSKLKRRVYIHVVNLLFLLVLVMVDLFCERKKKIRKCFLCFFLCLFVFFFPFPVLSLFLFHFISFFVAFILSRKSFPLVSFTFSLLFVPFPPCFFFNFFLTKHFHFHQSVHLLFVEVSRLNHLHITLSFLHRLVILVSIGGHCLMLKWKEKD